MMTNSSNGNRSKVCKDLDGILPIRREAWKLQEPLPSTTRNQLVPIIESGFSAHEQSQHSHFENLQQRGTYPVIAPVIWFYPFCQRCQSFKYH